MALNKQNSDYQLGELIILRPIMKDKDKKDIPVTFEVRRKAADGKFLPQADTASSVTGDLFRIETYTSEWEGNITHGYKLLLRDEEMHETYIVDMKFNMLTRSLANNVLALTNFKNITITLYKNNRGYNSVVVKDASGEMVHWKYELSQLPQPTEIFHPKLKDEKTGKPKLLSRDFSEVDDWFTNQLNEFALANGLVAKDKMVATNTSEVVEAEVVDVEEDEDGRVPF